MTRGTRWALAALAALGTGIWAYEAQDAARRELVPYLSRRISETLHRDITIGRVSFWPLGSVALMDVRVAPGRGETASPLVAERLRAYPSWWSLIVKHQILVRELHVDGARLATTLDLRHPDQKQASAAAQILALGKNGLQRLGIHRSQADVQTLLPGGAQPVSTRGLELTLDLKRDSFVYDARAARWSGAGVEAQDLAIRGRGDGQTIYVSRSRAKFNGGALAAKGTYAAQGDVDMQVNVRRLPLEGLGPQLGIPREWAVLGTLTGQIDVSASTGVLRSAKGRLDIVRGSIRHSNAVFPWSHATAQLDWRENGASLRDIDVQGDGIRLRGNAEVAGHAASPFPKRPFVTSGTVEVTKPDAVLRLARLMTFSMPLAGRWNLAKGTVNFQARGVPGDLARARASGRFTLDGLQLRLTPQTEPLVLPRVYGELERTPERLVVRNLDAHAQGIQAHGAVTVVPAVPKVPGRFDGAARIDLTSLATLRQQLPSFPYWKWINPETPGSRGQIRLAFHGPTAAPESAAGSGKFHLQQFAATVPSGQGQGRWSVPVRDLTGDAKFGQETLTLRNVRLASDLFQANADVAVRDLGGKNRATGSVRLVSDRWAELPPLQGRLPAGVGGGRLTVTARVPENPAAASAPLEGTADLRGATYRLTLGGQTRQMAVQEAVARFRMAGNRLVLPEYRIVTPQFRTTGSGEGRQVGGKGAPRWDLRADGTLVTNDAGALLRWWNGSAALTGGALTARYAAVLPPAGASGLAATAKVRLTDAQPHLPAGALPFPAADAKIVSLTGTFRTAGGKTQFEDAVWQAPRFKLTGSGTVERRIVDGRFHLATDEWRSLAGDLAKTVPASGGTLVVDGRLRGPVDRLKDLPLDGTVTLKGARLQSPLTRANTPGLIRSGSLDLTARAQGPLTHLVGANVDGRFAVRDLVLAPVRAGSAPVKIATAEGNFTRKGEDATLTDLVATAEGVRMTGNGELHGLGTPGMTHRLRLEASGPSLATLLPALAPVPGKASGGRFTGWITLAGNAADPTQRAEGRAEVSDAKWTPPGQTVAMDIRHMQAHFVRTGEKAVLDNVELRLAGGQATLAGTVQGLGTKAGPRHDLNLAWTLEDASGWASRFLPIPGGFQGGTFTGKARIDGTFRDPARTADGRFEITNAGFMPPQKFLGGPVKPIAVHWAKGLFHRDAGQTTLDPLELNTSVGTATGRVVADDRWNAKVVADGRIEKLEALVDLWPGFSDRLRGGRGELHLALNGPLRRPREMAGPVDITGRDGILTVEGMDPLYATHPFDEFTVNMELQRGGAVRLEHVLMHGPRANFEADGNVAANGQLAADGKAWFTKDYTRKVIRPGFLRPIAKIFGVKLKSDFKVTGSIQEARLNMDITRGTLWKLLIKSKVPEPLRKIATGQTPLWGGDAAEPPKRVAGRGQ